MDAAWSRSSSGSTFVGRPAKLALSKHEVDRACDHAKQEIRGEFAAARASAHREATLSKIMVDLHYMLAMVKAMVATVTTAAAIDSDKTSKMAEASRIEGESGRVNEL